LDSLYFATVAEMISRCECIYRGKQEFPSCYYTGCADGPSDR